MAEHPITPPQELVQQWINEENGVFAEHIATQAARWGADQELEACCEWLEKDSYGFTIAASAPHLTSDLRAARRPKPRSGEVAELVKLLRYEARVSGPHESAHPSWCAAMDRAADLLEQLIPPKLPSLKEQALERCNDYIDPDGIIRRALEALPDV